uniref:glucan 1,3-beta-glucosidase n=1 Tax=Meloidogyne hapla TaxID=6305 RepID=A0A1I8BC07_MELHA
MITNKIVLNLLFILSLYSLVAFAVNPPFGRLSVKSGQLTGAKGQAVQLRGISLWFSMWLTQWYSPEAVKAIKCFFNGNVVSSLSKSSLKNSNFQQVRAAIGTCCSGYLENPNAAIKAATTVADAAIANGIYFIIDWHDVANEKCTNDAEFKKFTDSSITFFTTILRKYKGYPNMVLELWNEPICPWNKLKQYYTAVLARIRKLDPYVVVILGTPWQSSGPTDEVINSPVLGRNLIWAFMDQNKLSYAKWSLSNKDEVYSLVLPHCTPAQANQTSCLSPSGKLLREHMLKQKNGK